MRFKDFGNTGIMVSEMCLGTWGIGGAGWDTYSEEDRAAAIYAAVDGGINFIDTAPAYNDSAEQRIGNVLKKYNLRNKLFISSKCGVEFRDGEYHKNLSREMIFKQIDRSLKFLGTDHIDVYFMHWPDVNTPIEETMDALNQIQKEGKIRFIGASNFSIAEMQEAEKYGKIDALQVNYSMVERKVEESMKWAAETGKGVMAYGPLHGGLLTGRFTEPKDFGSADVRGDFYPMFNEPGFSKTMKLIEVMKQVAAAHSNATVAQVAMNWATKKDYVSTAIVGAQTADKVTRNIAAYEWQISDEEMALLDKAIADLGL